MMRDASNVETVLYGPPSMTQKKRWYCVIEMEYPHGIVGRLHVIGKQGAVITVITAVITIQL